MSINSSGDFSWTPSEAQGGASYSATITVTDDGSPNLSTFETIAITVNEVNVTPVVDPISGPTAAVRGQTLDFAGSFSDTDIPDTHTLQWVVTRENVAATGGDLCDEHGKPQVLTILYTGDNIVSHSQDANKVNVTGDPNFDSDVFIRASDKVDPNAGNAKVWFTGVVSLDGTFDIDATPHGDETRPERLH